MQNITKLVPGLFLALVIALAATLLDKVTPGEVVNDVIFAIMIGVVLRNTMTVPEAVMPGMNFILKRLLKLAIILLGIRLSLAAVLQTGGQALGIIVLCVITAITITYWIGKKLGLTDKLATLIGVGTAICGATAIVATGPAIEAKEDDISYAVATIFVFNIIAMFTYPVIAHLIGLSDTAFGFWSGTAIHDTTSVVAAGFAFSDKAGEVATIVKLTRTVLLVPVALVISVLFAMKGQIGKGNKGSLVKSFPWFIFGFIAMAMLNTFGVFPQAVVTDVNAITKFLIVIVMAAVGLGVDLSKMRQVGLNFLYAGLIASVIMAGFSLTLIKVFNIG